MMPISVNLFKFNKIYVHPAHENAASKWSFLMFLAAFEGLVCTPGAPKYHQFLVTILLLFTVLPQN